MNLKLGNRAKGTAALLFVLFAFFTSGCRSRPLAIVCNESTDKYSYWVKVQKIIDHGDRYEIRVKNLPCQGSIGWDFQIFSVKCREDSLPTGAVKLKKGNFYRMRIKTMPQILFGADAIDEPGRYYNDIKIESDYQHAASEDIRDLYCIPVDTISPNLLEWLLKEHNKHIKNDTKYMKKRSKDYDRWLKTKKRIVGGGR